MAPWRTVSERASAVRKPASAIKDLQERYALDTDRRGEIHDDAVNVVKGVIVDDVIATGGTAKATTALVRKLGGDIVGLAFLVELLALNGRAQLAGEKVYTVLQY